MPSLTFVGAGRQIWGGILRASLESPVGLRPPTPTLLIAVALMLDLILAFPPLLCLLRSSLLFPEITL